MGVNGGQKLQTDWSLACKQIKAIAEWLKKDARSRELLIRGYTIIVDDNDWALAL